MSLPCRSLPRSPLARGKQQRRLIGEAAERGSEILIRLAAFLNCQRGGAKALQRCRIAERACGHLALQMPHGGRKTIAGKQKLVALGQAREGRRAGRERKR